MGTRIDGQAEALKLLRCLRELNWHLEKPKLSARLVDYMLRSLSDWPVAERQRFSRITGVANERDTGRNCPECVLLLHA